MDIKFHGAARMVTGSNYLIETEDYKILIDCGMFQGNQVLEKMNFEKFPYNPGDIDFLILTHAHIDHSGRIPKLVKEGFRGRIISTNPSYELCRIMLLDSANIQESDTRWENKRRERAGKPLLEPLYTAKDADNSLNYFEPYFLNQKIRLNDHISLRFKDAGHILGSAIVELWVREKGEEVKFVFSGDLGVKGRLIINDPEFIEEADYLIVESTYGNTVHESFEEGSKKLIEIINKTVLRGGTAIIPSFAVGRTQELIYELNNYYEHTDLEEYMKVPVYVDSPMAVKATKVFKRNSSSFNEEAKARILAGDNPFEFENLRYIDSQEESMLLNKFKFPKVIISSSGMANAGRVRHHLKHNLWDEKNSLIFVGYQAQGTLGRILQEGAKRVKLLGEDIDVKLEVHSIKGFSGHADRAGILRWINGFKKKPKKIFVVHGEEEAASSLAEEIGRRFDIPTVIPKLDDSYEIQKFGIELSGEGEPITDILKDEVSKQLNSLSEQFTAFIDREDELLDEKLINEEYNSINNNLIELNHILMDLNMIMGK